MNTPKHGKEEQKILKQLPCIEKVTAKMLIFKQSFKGKTVAKSKQGYTSNAIFAKAGIDITKYAPRHTLYASCVYR